MDTGTIIASMLFGSVGMGYMIYGKRQSHGVAIFCGFVLCASPYAISNLPLLIAVNLAAIALPIMRRG
jgi:hypothetical protein